MKLQDLENWQFTSAMFNSEFNQDDVLHEAVRRYKANEMKDWEVKNLFAIVGIGNLKPEEFQSKFSLVHDLPEVREYLFYLVTKFAGDSLVFWSGTSEGKNEDFMRIIKYNAYINKNDLSQQSDAQFEVIQSLGKLLLRDSLSGSCVYHLRDIAAAFLDTSIKDRGDKIIIEEYKTKIETLVDTIKAEKLAQMKKLERNRFFFPDMDSFVTDEELLNSSFANQDTKVWNNI